MPMDGPLEIDLAGLRLIPDAEGTLFAPASRSLLVADLHFEKGSAQAQLGRHLPPYDTKSTLDRLSAMVAKYTPARLIALGDSFHDTAGPSRMDRTDHDRLLHLAETCELVWIAGNHDPVLPAHMPGRAVDELTLGPVKLVHQPRPEVTPEIAGHLHPVARIRQRGRRLRRKCFVVSASRIIMPSFGAYTGGLDVRAQAFCALFVHEPVTTWMLGKGRVFPITSTDLRAA